jgi:hypothetical protein
MTYSWIVIFLHEKVPLLRSAGLKKWVLELTDVTTN